MRAPLLAAPVLALVLAAAAPVSAAPPVNKADQAFFNKHIHQLVTLKPTLLASDALAKISDAQFYNLDVIVNGGSSTIEVARLHDELIPIALPDTTAPMPDFSKILKPDFKLQSDADAHTLQDALDVLYPITGQDNAAAKTIKHTGTTWTFIRGKFFDHFEAIIITTDPSGKITAVKRSLEA